jgi:WD40 repeat protein
MNKLLHKYQGKQYSNGNARAEISPSEKYVVAGNSDGSIYYWNKDT